MRRWALRTLRLAGIVLLAAAAAGLVAGVGLRLGMRIEAAATPGAPRFTLGGTARLIGEVTRDYALPAALPFAALRRWLPWTAARQGLAYGVLLLAPATPVLILRATVPGARLLFGACCLLYGLSLALAMAGLDRVLPRPRR